MKWGQIRASSFIFLAAYYLASLKVVTSFQFNKYSFYRPLSPYTVNNVHSSRSQQCYRKPGPHYEGIAHFGTQLKSSKSPLTSDGIPAHHKPKIETKLDSIPAEQSIEIARIASERSTEKLAVLGDEFQKKALNACLLVACFGFVTYLVLNVDNGMTRGWTMSEKAMRIPLDNWSSYESSLNEQPIFTKTMINVVIYLLGDWLSQTVFVKKNILDFDAGRTFRNGFIGMVFGPLVHEYYEFSDHILPVDQVVNRFYKILMDQTLYISIKCSIYIIAVNMLAGESWEYSTNMVKEKLKGIMFTAWKFWPLVHCVTYGAIPAQHRILWVNCVDLFWNAILALKTSTDDDEEDIEVSSKPHGRLESLSSDFNLDVNAQGEDILKLSTHSDIVEKDCSEEVISSTSIKVSMENSILASVEEADKTGQPSGLGSDHLETPDQPSLVSNSTETKVIECS